MKSILMKTPVQNRNATRGSVNSPKPLRLTTSRNIRARVEQAREAIVGEFRSALPTSEHWLRLAVNEAEALAWQTDYPHLLFPTLAVEKLETIATWHAQQQAFWQQQSPLRLAA